MDSFSLYFICGGLSEFKLLLITVDLQHGMLDFNHCRNILQILNKYKVFPIVRVPNNETGIINKCLDAGAKGIICPLINTKEDCEKFIESCFMLLKVSEVLVQL